MQYTKARLIQCILTVLRPVVRTYQKVSRRCFSLIPTMLFEILYVPSHDEEACVLPVVPIYHMMSQAHDWSAMKHEAVPDEGHYFFSLWNKKSLSLEHYALSADHFAEALNVLDLSMLWSFRPSAIAEVLAEYVARQPKALHIFDILLQGQDVTQALAPYKSSMELGKNVTALVAYILLKLKDFSPPFVVVKDTPVEATITDFSLDMFTATNNEFLETHADDSHTLAIHEIDATLGSVAEAPETTSQNENEEVRAVAHGQETSLYANE